LASKACQGFKAHKGMPGLRAQPEQPVRLDSRDLSDHKGRKAMLDLRGRKEWLDLKDHRDRKDRSERLAQPVRLDLPGPMVSLALTVLREQPELQVRPGRRAPTEL
jgi:hypothetical protein